MVRPIFRSTVVASVILYTVYVFLPLFDDQLLDYMEKGARDLAGANSRILFDMWQFWLMYAAFLIASVGLYFFMPWSRTVFIVAVAASIAISLFSGLHVLTNYELVIGGIVSMCDGAIIAMMYLTSIGELFERNVT